jgi:hypothetical protein
MPKEEANNRGDSLPTRSARSRKRQSPWPLAISLASMLGAVAAVLFVLNRNQPPPAPSEAEPTPAVAAVGPAMASMSDSSSPSAHEEAVDDAQCELLWLSPTDGPALALDYVPAGTQCLLHLRPGLILGTPEGERILAALGLWGQQSIKQLRDILGAELADIDSLVIAIVVNSKSQLETSFRAELKNAWSDDELARRFPKSQAGQLGDQTYRTLDKRSYFLPKDASRKNILVVCPEDLAEDLIDSRGEAPALVRDVESLAQHADADRAAALIVAPKFLEMSGSDLLTGEAQRLRDALRWLVGRDATAIALSVHLDENLFAELRAVPALNVPPRRLAIKLRERIAAAPDAVEDMIAAANWPPYGRKVLARFPGMLRALARYSRAAEDDRQALVRCYLPAVAAHNLLMGGELLLTQSSSEAASPKSIAAAEKPTTLEERLAKKTSLVFTKDSLERALELLADDTGISIAIQGSDLQLDGITKNQSLAMDAHDQPAGEILVQILRRANPDRTATGPDDPRQKLVYVVEPEKQGTPARILVTTRSAAAKGRKPLPAAFLPKKP